METTDQFNGKPESVESFIDLVASAVVDCGELEIKGEYRSQESRIKKVLLFYNF